MGDTMVVPVLGLLLSAGVTSGNGNNDFEEVLRVNSVAKNFFITSSKFLEDDDNSDFFVGDIAASAEEEVIICLLIMVGDDKGDVEDGVTGAEAVVGFGFGEGEICVDGKNGSIFEDNVSSCLG